MPPPRLPRGTRLGFPLKAVLALYVLAAAVLPLAHHDIACHLKSSTHCTTCVVASTAELAADATVLAATTLRESGRASTGPAVRAESRPLSASAGRAPPIVV